VLLEANLRRMRQEHGWTKKDLADRAQIDDRDMGTIETA